MTRNLIGLPQAAAAALLLAFALPLAAAPIGTAPTTVKAATAAAGAPLHLVVAGPATPITDVLFDLGKQANATIIADDTVKATLPAMTFDKPDLAQTLDAIVAASPGLSWQKVSLAADASLPDANTLSAQVRALKIVTESHLLVADPVARTTLRFARESTSSQAAPASGMQTVYLVTNESARAQAAPAADAAGTDKSPVALTVAGMQAAADQFGKLTPAEQGQAVPLMYLQFQRIYQSMDPNLRAALTNQMQQQGTGGP